MATEEVTINGNTVWRDTGLTHRWYDAIGPDVCKVVEDFVDLPFSAADNMAAWTTTLIEEGADESTIALVAGSAGGEVAFKSDENDNDGVQAQLKGEAFYLAARYPTYFGAKFKVSDVTNSDLLVGLCITDTTLLGGLSDGLYFRKDEDDTTLYLVAEKGSVETKIGLATMVAATYVTAEFLFYGSIVYVYVNGVQVAELADSDPNFPDDEYLTPSIGILAGAAAVGGKTLTVDWLNCIQVQAV
jgi:hypothetical protein